MKKVIRNKVARVFMLSMVVFSLLGGAGVGVAMAGDCPGGASSCGN